MVVPREIEMPGMQTRKEMTDTPSALRIFMCIAQFFVRSNRAVQVDDKPRSPKCAWPTWPMTRPRSGMWDIR